ncbi:MAG: GntR family transcriptional regulator [Deltaproteobacteria bacterium]|nr:GntR family transcriptional regulator [Deltaproteobacteria bacterium]
MGFAKIQKKTLRQQVYEQLKERMITAEILPGEQITLRNLAERLGVSLMPVREALWQLESEGAVVIEANKRMRVNNLTFKDVQEILKIRLNLEIMAAETACDLRTPSTLKALEKTLARMRASEDKPEAYLRANRHYHFTIYKAAEAPILLDLISRLWIRFGPYIHLVTRKSADIVVSNSYHEIMYEAIKARDKESIGDAIRNDLQMSARVVKDLLETPELMPGPIYRC